MPTYQYACTECGHQFETVQSFSDASLTECPACTGKLRKVFNAVGIVFKGSGFYRTDSRSTPPAADGASGTAKDKPDAPAAAAKDGAGSSTAAGTSASPATAGSATAGSATAGSAAAGSSTAGSAA